MSRIKTLGIGIIGNNGTIIRDILVSYDKFFDDIELTFYTDDKKRKINFIKDTIQECTDDYLVFLDSSFKISPNYIELIDKAISESPDCVSCPFTDSFGTTIYSISNHRGTDTHYPTYFNVIKTKHLKSLDIPEIDVLVEKCYSDLLYESGLLSKEYHIFDILISKE